MQGPGASGIGDAERGREWTRGPGKYAHATNARENFSLSCFGPPHHRSPRNPSRVYTRPLHPNARMLFCVLSCFPFSNSIASLLTRQTRDASNDSSKSSAPNRGNKTRAFSRGEIYGRPCCGQTDFMPRRSNSKYFKESDSCSTSVQAKSVEYREQ